MKAAVYYRPNQPLTVEELDLLEPQRGEVTVRVAAASYSSETPFR
jgi:Zn-dependent alcohol dehydrogenase